MLSKFTNYTKRLRIMIVFSLPCILLLRLACTQLYNETITYNVLTFNLIIKQFIKFKIEGI